MLRLDWLRCWFTWPPYRKQDSDTQTTPYLACCQIVQSSSSHFWIRIRNSTCPTPYSGPRINKQSFPTLTQYCSTRYSLPLIQHPRRVRTTPCVGIGNI